MLTRLVARGFKNLDVDVQLGPFTCIAGPNGVGKSNVFDVVAFLSALARKPLLEAALGVRGGAGRMGDVRGLFRRTGDASGETMFLLAEMIIPPLGEDQLGQVAEASITYVRYEIALRYRTDLPARPNSGITIERESLTHLNLGEARRLLGFPHSSAFRDSCILGRRTTPYISTEDGFVLLHADSRRGKGSGGQRRFRAEDLPRTVLSTAEDAALHRTAMLARREMSSWAQIHLEPSAMRAPDDFTASQIIAPNGAHLPSTLYRLAQEALMDSPGGDADVYSRVANRLSELVEEVRTVGVDVDEKRQLISVVMTDRHGTPHLASSLSDGTLRFLALAVMNEEPSSRALLCLEEPENGMHPSRVPAMIRLLQDIAVDVQEAVGPDNPLRQVLINTHSPSVVAEVPDDALLIAKLVPGPEGDESVVLAPLSHTWRTAVAVAPRTVMKGELLAYLNPVVRLERPLELPRTGRGVPGLTRPRVKDRPDLQLMLYDDGAHAAE